MSGLLLASFGRSATTDQSNTEERLEGTGSSDAGSGVPEPTTTSTTGETEAPANEYIR